MHRREMLELARKVGKVSGPTVAGDEDRRMRDCEVAKLDLTHPLVLTLLDRLAQANRAWWQFDLTRMQAAQFCVYRENQHFAWHKDSPIEFFPQPVRRPELRKLTAIALLSHSSEYSGGNLEFRDESGVVYRSALLRAVGSITLFPSHVFHRITPIESGTRMSIVAWMLGPPFR